ncbi:hypothetical protein CCB81_03985 [Armatimonadetes bacterium Uphvl-Ar2]|nr:hypothetical protein CCB81_03985 [Armatimonadetes bacterium Uphvl-Ar2]
MHRTRGTSAGKFLTQLLAASTVQGQVHRALYIVFRGARDEIFSAVGGQEGGTHAPGVPVAHHGHHRNPALQGVQRGRRPAVGERVQHDVHVGKGGVHVSLFGPVAAFNSARLNAVCFESRHQGIGQSRVTKAAILQDHAAVRNPRQHRTPERDGRVRELGEVVERTKDHMVARTRRHALRRARITSKHVGQAE